MIDKTDDTHSDNPTNNQLENLADKIIPSQNIATINQNQQAENMEVHHHPDLHHKPKKWKEYFLEFLMIFLAVTLGFFAENLREHISDMEKTKIFAALLYQDCQTNSHSLTQIINFTTQKIESIDSISNFINPKSNRNVDSNLYRCIVYLISTSPFDNIDGAYEQIKNTGSLRFFNQSLINNLNSYDATALKLKQMEDWENKVLYEQVIPRTGEMFNFSVFDDLRNRPFISHEMYLRNLNKESTDILLNQSIVIKHLRERQLNQQKGLLQKNNEILSGLQKEYGFK